jgi:hypothetical protein
MKITWIRAASLLIGLTAAGLLPHLAAQAPKKPATEQRIFLVAGTASWTETDILIRPIDKVSFKATGKVCFHTNATQSCQGPAGWGRTDYANSWPDDYNECEDPISDANHGALIGSIGGSLFYIGPEKTITNKEGQLKLGINDCTFTGEYGNFGSFSVVVSIVRGESPKK